MHEQWQEMLLYYVNGALSNEERKAVEGHLTQCADCRAAAEEWRALAQVATAEVETLKDELPPLVLPGNTRYAPRRPNSPPDRKPDRWEDRKMLFNTVLRLPAQPRRLTLPLTLIAALALTLLVSSILIFNNVPNLSVLLSPQQQATPTTIFERYINDVWNAGNLDVLGELLAPEFKQYDAALAEPIADIEALKAYVEHCRSSLPGVTFNVDQAVETGDMVYARLTAAGEGFTVPLTASARLADGKLAEVWFDANALLETRLALVEQQNAAAARREFEEGFINRSADAAAGEYVKEGAVWCAGANPGHCTRLTNAFRKDWVNSLYVAFPDLDLTIQQVVASGDTVFVELTGSGTLSKMFMEPMTGKTLSPTNKQETWSWLWIGTFEDGKIAKERWYWYWYNWPVKPPA